MTLVCKRDSSTFLGGKGGFQPREEGCTFYINNVVNHGFFLKAFRRGTNLPFVVNIHLVCELLSYLDKENVD